MESLLHLEDRLGDGDGVARLNQGTHPEIHELAVEACDAGQAAAREALAWLHHPEQTKQSAIELRLDTSETELVEVRCRRGEQRAPYLGMHHAGAALLLEQWTIADRHGSRLLCAPGGAHQLLLQAARRIRGPDGDALHDVELLGEGPGEGALEVLTTLYPESEEAASGLLELSQVLARAAA